MSKADVTYSVVVGNIGTVYNGPSKIEANRAYTVYTRQSKSNCGRAAGEPVAMFMQADGCEEIIKEHSPRKRLGD